MYKDTRPQIRAKQRNYQEKPNKTKQSNHIRGTMTTR